MSSVISEDAGAVRVALNAGTTARLFGIPFVLVGAYLGYQLVAGLVDLMTGQATVSEMLAGTVLLFAVTAAFLIPGWLLIFSRAAVEIDRTNRTVNAVRDLRVYRLTDRRSLSEFERIEVDVLSVAPNRRSSSRGRSYQVELAARNRQNVVVGLLDDGDEALAYGRRLGSLIGLPVEDLRHTEAAPDE